MYFISSSLIILFILVSNIYSQNLMNVPDSLKQDLKKYFSFKADNKDSTESIKIDKNLYSSFDIPEFGYKEFRIGSDKLLNYKKVGEESTYSANFEGEYKVYKQTLYSTVDYSIKTFYDFIKENESEEFSALQLQIPFDFSQFSKHNNSGFQFFSNGEMTISQIGEDDLLNQLDLTTGIGYGRVTSVRPIARAVALVNELGLNLENEDIINIANIITQNNSGFYTKKYKSEAKIYYYNELAKALNVSDKIMKIQQIMEDPAFSNISDRKIGWQFRLGTQNYYDAFTEEFTNLNLSANLEFAKPIGFNKQLITELILLQQENNDIEPEFKTSFSIDHTITWVSNIELKYNSLSTEFKLSTTKELINKVSGQMYLNFTKPNEDDLELEFNIKLIYLAF